MMGGLARGATNPTASKFGLAELVVVKPNGPWAESRPTYLLNGPWTRSLMDPTHLTTKHCLMARANILSKVGLFYHIWRARVSLAVP